VRPLIHEGLLHTAKYDTFSVGGGLHRLFTTLLPMNRARGWFTCGTLIYVLQNTRRTLPSFGSAEICLYLEPSNTC